MGTTLRRAVSGVLTVLVAVLVPAAIVAEYVRGVVLDTDRYVRTVSELAEDPAIQDAVTDRVTARIVAADQARVPEPVVREVVGTLVGSDRFGDLWWRANRVAHESLFALLTGDTTVVRIDPEGAVTVPLDDVVDEAREALAERGFVAVPLPDGDATVVLFRAPELAQAQDAVRLLDAAAPFLAGVAAVVVLGAVLFAPRGSRRRAVGLVGFAVAAGTATVIAVGALARAVYLHDLSEDVVRPEVATAAVDVLTGPLVFDMWLAFSVGVLVVLGSWLIGLIRRPRGDTPAPPDPSPPSDPPATATQ